MSKQKQILARVGDDIKTAGDAIMALRGETQQDLLAKAYTNYVIEYAGMMPNGDDILHAAYTYALEQQRAAIAPLLEKIEQRQSAKAAEEAQQIELMEQYNTISTTPRGRKLLNILARRLQYDDHRNAIIDVFIDDPERFREVFAVDQTDDDNQLVTIAMSMARIHTTQV